jgi:hypothetical protein
MIDLVIDGVGRMVRRRKIHPFRPPGTQTNFLSQSKRTPDGGYLRREKGNKLHPVDDDNEEEHESLSVLGLCQRRSEIGW